MKDLILSNEKDLTERLLAYVLLIKPADGVNIVCKFETAMEILRAFLKFDFISVATITAATPDLNKYEKEYAVTIDSSYRIWVEPLYNDPPLYDVQYVTDPDCLTFVHQDCSYDSVKQIDEDCLIPFCFEYETEEE